ncbi:hypothetical protein AVEN_86967-1 [Araneus ventricosus]|uniref:Tc1-like transposase DDE domain-containing protein n=1 Tax=Araneus ventricosus TaxID=182803 RepID=A0A4Y2MDT5_ARAVE|nr:hypothetical protein AVEN_86967-1 [Araneus ventricosus]
MGDSGTRSCDRTDQESCELSEHHCGSVALLHGVSLPTGNGIFQQDNAPCHKAQSVLEWFEEHTHEFHLMSWSSNSFDVSWSGSSELKRRHVRISRLCVTAA